MIADCIILVDEGDGEGWKQFTHILTEEDAKKTIKSYGKIFPGDIFIVARLLEEK